MLWLRAIVVYALVVLLLRFLWRALRFQARPYDHAVEVLIGSAAGNMVSESEIPLWPSFGALGVLVVMHSAVSLLSLWNPVKQFLVGTPDVLIKNGQILQGNLVKNQITVEELTAALREKGYHNLADVEHAQLEASGRLSLIPRSQARPVTPRDLHVDTPDEGYTRMLISDGQVNTEALKKLGRDEAWLVSAVRQRGAASPAEVLFASLDTQGDFFMVRKQDVPLLQAVFKGVQAQAQPGNQPTEANQHRPSPRQSR
jgi:uncharacterized membrane protein YcaP (DUF421 family)